MDETTFLDKDYERKINFLIQQYSRMWTRFNFFITIESSLIGGKFLFNPTAPTTNFAILGVALSLIWYVFGANDKYLVDVYREAVEEAADKLTAVLSLENSYKQTKYKYVGDAKAKYPDVKQGILSWRINIVSITHLAAVFPLLLTIAWTGYLIRVLVLCQP